MDIVIYNFDQILSQYLVVFGSVFWSFSGPFLGYFWTNALIHFGRTWKAVWRVYIKKTGFGVPLLMHFWAIFGSIFCHFWFLFFATFGSNFWWFLGPFFDHFWSHFLGTSGPNFDSFLVPNFDLFLVPTWPFLVPKLAHCWRHPLRSSAPKTPNGGAEKIEPNQVALNLDPHVCSYVIIIFF